MMDALDFLKARKRMCEATKCASCKLYPVQGGCCIAPDHEKIDAFEEAIAIVGQWAKEHPTKTRQSVFLEQYPETEIDKYGCLRLCPELVSADYRNRHGDCINRVCIDCRREFWMQEVEDV